MITELDYPIKALIIDDLSDNRELLRLDLEDEIENIEVDEAENGQKALELLAENEYTIVICDVMMPRLDGYEVLEASRKLSNNAEVPFIFLSANKQKDAAETGLKAGAIDYLTKPYNLTELIYKVRNLSRVKHLYQKINDSKEELERINEDLKRLNEEKDDVLRIVSHDMRSPLSSIIGLAAILKDGDYSSDEEVHELSNMIQYSGENLLKLVNSLLDVAKLESGVIKIEKEFVYLRYFLENILYGFEPLAKKKQIELVILLPEQKCKLFIDKPKIHQIVSNLVSNALKFTPFNGKVTIEFNVNGKDLHFCVADTGIGIESEMLDEIFKKFGNYQRQGTSKEKGTGLGLSIVKRFVELHGGTIKVESNTSEGTKFKIVIPEVVNQ